MAAHTNPDKLGMIEAGLLQPEKLIGQHLTLEESIDALVNMDQFAVAGVSVIDAF